MVQKDSNICIPYGDYMEKWVADWLAEQRRKGIRQLEVKRSNNAYYVYRSTTRWDRELKKRRKTSKYVGRLDREKGLVESSRKVLSAIHPRSVFRYGDALLLHKSMESLLPILREAFPGIWQELYAVSLVRITGHVPLKRVRSRWEKLYNPDAMTPSLEPTHLPDVLRMTGVDRDGQRTVFGALMKGEQFAYVITAVFTRSTMNIADLGHNRSGLHVPQVNLILLSSVTEHTPSMIRAVPGSIGDVSTLIKSLSDIDLRGIILVLDRGFFSEDNIDELMDGGLNFIMPARRNSLLYGRVARKLTGHLFYQDRLVRFSKKRAGRRFLYLYQDSMLAREEENTLYRMLDDGKLDNDEFRERMWKAGKILIISNMDTDGKRVYEMYKGREDVEQQFDTFKSTLHSDIMYLRDDESVFGHMFVAFLSLYGYCTMQNMLRKASLLEKVSPADLLEEFSSVYAITDGERMIVTEVPRRARELDEQLGTNLFPKNES